MKAQRCAFSAHQTIGVLLAIGLLLAGAANTVGDVLTWDGSASALWSNPQNWVENAVPGDGDYLVFPNTASNKVMTNDIVGLNVLTIEVTGTGYSFHGNTIGLIESIRLNTTFGMVAYMYMDIDLTSDAQIRMMGFNNILHCHGTIDTASYVLNVGNYGAVFLYGPITGSGSVVKFGSGDVYMQGSSGNTYAGPTTAEAGTLILDQATGNSVPQNLIIEDGATVLQQASARIGSDVIIYGAGLYDMNGYSETIVDLVLYDGADFDSGISTLTLVGDVTVDGGVSAIGGTLSLFNGSHDFNILFNGLIIWPGAHCYLNADVIGAGNLIKKGSGDMRISGNNSYAGATEVQNGDVMIESNTALGTTAAGTTVNAGCKIYMSAFNPGSSKNIVGETLSLGGAIYSYGVADSWEAPITLTGDVQIKVWSGDSLELLGAIDGAGGVTKTGTGTLIYSGSPGNTYSGDTDVQEGMLLLSKSSGNGVNYGTLTIGDGAGSAKTVVVREQANIQIGTIPIIINADGWLDVDTYNDTVGAITFNGGYASSTPPGTLFLGGHVTANPSAAVPRIDGQLNIGSGSYERTFDVAHTEAMYIGAVISGSAGITKTGGGHLLLESANTYSGLTTVQAGYLTPMDDLSLGAVANGTVIEGGTLRLYSAAVAGESLTANSGGRLESIGAVSEWGGPVTLNGDIWIWIPNIGESLEISGAMGGIGGFVKSGPGNLILSCNNANSYSGDTRVYGGLLELAEYNVIRYGTLIVGNNSGGPATDIVRFSSDFPIHSDAATVINSDGWIDFDGHFDDLGSLLFDRGHITTGTGGMLSMLDGDLEAIESFETNWTAYISGNVRVPVQRTFDIDTDVFFDLSAPTEGNGGITKTGGGWLRLGWPNTYIGTTIAQEGYLQLWHTGSLGATNGGTVVQNGASLVYGKSLVITNEALELNGLGAPNYGALDTVADAGWKGPVELNTDSRIFVASATLEIDGPVSGAGGLEKVSTGTLLFSGSEANSYAGDTDVLNGTLLLDKSVYNSSVPGNLYIGTAVGSPDTAVVKLLNTSQIPSSSRITIADSGLFDMNNLTELFGSLAGSGHVVMGSGNLRTGVDGSSTEFSGLIEGSGYFRKEGSGTLTLSGNNTYSGETRVYQGTLLVNGSQPGSDVVVSPSTILGGIGTVGAIDSDGTVAPGNSPGRLGSGDTLLQAGSLFDVELNGYMPADCDQLDVNGAVKLDNADLKIAWGFVPAVGDTFTILDNDGADVITGTFNGLPDGSTLTAGNVELKITYAGGTGNDIVLTAADVTELGPLHFISMGMHATNAAMEWAGGVPFYRLEKKESLTNDLWIAVTPLTRDFSGMVPADTTNGFYRVTGGH